MNRKQYIKALSARLRFRLPEEDIEEILGEISERFDEGAAEGISEESICSSLGSPEAAAGEFLRGAEGNEKRDFSRNALSVAASLLLIGAFIWAAGYAPAGIAYTLPLLPWAIWLICERKSLAKSLCSYPCDVFMATSALLLTGAVLSFAGLMNEALQSCDSLDLMYMCLCTVLIIGAMAAWAASLRRRSGKYLLFLPAAGIAGAIWAAAFSFDFFAANGFYSMSVSPMADYYGRVGRYGMVFIRIILLLSAVCLVRAVIKRDALSPVTLSLMLGAAGGGANVYRYLSYLDPADPLRPALDIHILILGGAAGAVWLAVVTAVRCGKRRAASWKRVR